MRIEPRRAGAALGVVGGGRTARLRLVGLAFIVVAAVVIALGVAKPNPFDDRQTVTAVFDETASLGKILRTVRVEGVNVGTIGDVRRVGDDSEVELLIDPDVSVHEDARAEIRPHIFFEGTVFVELYPGSESAPPLAGDTIPLERTDVFIPFDVALRALDHRHRKAISGLSDETAEGLGGPARGGVRQTLRNAPELLEDVAPAARAAQGPHRNELNGAIQGMANTLEGLATQEERIAPLVSDARRTVEAVGTREAAPLDATIRQLPSTLVEVDRGGDALRRILDRLDPLAVELEPALVELTPTLREARPVLADARPVLRRSTPLLRDVRQALALTADAAPETRGLLLALEPSLDILTDSTLPYLHRDTGLGIPNYEQLVAFLSGFNGVLRPYQTAAQNPAGSGHLARIEADFTGEGGALPPLPLLCDDLDALDPRLRERIEALGLCG